MTELTIVAALTGGALLGLLFYGGLWLTVRRLPSVRHPALLVLASLTGRLALAAGGLYLLAAGNGWRLLAAAVGFLALRFVLARTLPAPLGATG